MFASVLCVLMLIIFWKLKKKCLFFVAEHILEFMCFQKQSPKAVRNRCSAKILCKSLALVKLLHAYSSTKYKLLLKYFIKKNIWKNTSNSSCLLLVFLKIVIKKFFCFLWPCSKELAVTSKCCYEKNSLVETTLK